MARTWVPPKPGKRRPGRYWPSLDLWGDGEVSLVGPDWAVTFLPRGPNRWEARINRRIDAHTAQSLKEALSDLDIASARRG